MEKGFIKTEHVRLLPDNGSLLLNLWFHSNKNI